MRFYKRVNDQWVVKRASAFEDCCKCFFVRKPRPVWPVRSERVKTIDDGQNSGTQRNICPGYSGRITISVPVFVMVSDDWNNGIWKLDRRQKVGADFGVELHLLEFRIRKFPRLVQNV